MGRTPRTTSIPSSVSGKSSAPHRHTEVTRSCYAVLCGPRRSPFSVHVSVVQVLARGTHAIVPRQASSSGLQRRFTTATQLCVPRRRPDEPSEMLAQELKNSVEADDQGCSEDYYHLLLSRVDETLEETKREKTKRRREVDVQHGGGDDSYRVELYVAGASPLQVMTYMIDPDNRRYLSPSVVSVITERDERDGQGVEHLELSLRVRQILCCCIPVTRTIRVKYCIEKEKERLVCHEEAGMVEKSQHYTFEEDSGGTHVTCVVQLKRPRWSVGCSSPISESEHVLLLQRLKAIMELDDPLLVVNGTDATSSLLYTDL